MSFATTLGFEQLSLELHHARLRAVVGEGHTNMHGTGHGGFVYALADEAFALASNSGDADAVALSVHMDYFRAVRPGDALEAEARAEHVGRRVATYRVEVRNGDTVVALFTGTVYRRERAPDRSPADAAPSGARSGGGPAGGAADEAQPSGSTQAPEES